MAENQSENISQYCPKHDHVISTQCEIKKGFKWLIGLLVTELMAIIAGLSGIIGVLISKLS
jgi:hypothetical protein